MTAVRKDHSIASNKRALGVCHKQMLSLFDLCLFCYAVASMCLISKQLAVFTVADGLVTLNHCSESYLFRFNLTSPTASDYIHYMLFALLIRSANHIDAMKLNRYFSTHLVCAICVAIAVVLQTRP